EQMAEQAAFQTEVRAVRAAPSKERMQRAHELIARKGNPPATYPMARALVMLLRDSASTPENWTAVLDFVRKLPPQFATDPKIKKIVASPAPQAANVVRAIPDLETLIDLIGPTPERLGMLGGRHKRLANAAAASEAERRQALDKAISYYEQG